MATKPPVCLYSGKLATLAAGDTIDCTTLSAFNNLTAGDVGFSDVLPEYNNSAAANRGVTMAKVGGFIDPTICDFRLSGQVGVPISTTDQLNISNLYLIPKDGPPGNNTSGSATTLRASTTATGTTSVTINVPTNVNGDLLVCFVSFFNSNVASAPSGWTLLTSNVISSLGLAVYFKVASSEPANYTFTGGGTGNNLATMLSVENAAVTPESISITPGPSTASPVPAYLQQSYGPNRLLISMVCEPSSTSCSIHGGNSNFTDVGFITAGGIVGMNVGTFADSSVNSSTTTFNVTVGSAGASIGLSVGPPYTGRISLYDGTRWTLNETGTVVLPLTATSGNVYDVFAYLSSGVVKLETLVWTSTTVRGTWLGTQNGVLVKSSDTTRRYIGTVYANGTNTTEDSAANRFIWNQYNRVPRPFVAPLPTSVTISWAYTTATWRAANNSTTTGIYRVNAVIGNSYEPVQAKYTVTAANSTGNWQSAGIGLNSTSTNSAQIFSGGSIATSQGEMPVWGEYEGWPAIGFNYFQALEISQNAGASTWNVTGNLAFVQGGINGRIWA